MPLRRMRLVLNADWIPRGMREPGGGRLTTNSARRGHGRTSTIRTPSRSRSPLKKRWLMSTESDVLSLPTATALPCAATVSCARPAILRL